MDHSSFNPGKIWNDTHGTPINAHGGGVLFHEDTYYWYGEHKIEGEAGNLAMVGVHCYSSTDLYNWVDEGICLPVSTKPGHDIEKGCILERPKVIFNKKTAKFVMWFHLEKKDQGYDHAGSGVAVADTPTGPFEYQTSFRPNAGHFPVNDFEFLHVPGLVDGCFTGDHPHPRLNVAKSNIFLRDMEGGQMARDMTLFVDDDGKAYHIYSAEENSTLHISQLTDDYTRPSGNFARAFHNRYMEAAAIFKRDGIYYIIASGCTSWDPNAMRCAMADNIMGPWHEMENPCHDINPQNGFGPDKSFGGQSTYVLPVKGKKNAYIAMLDIWCPENAIDGRYAWLPIEFADDGVITITWQNEWDLSVFE